MPRHLILLLAAALVATACQPQRVRQVVSDPAHQRVVDFLLLLEQEKFDDMYAMYDAETREAWPKEQFVDWAKKRVRYAQFYKVTKVERSAEANKATISTELTGRFYNKNGYADAIFDPVLLLNAQDKQWYLRNTRVVEIAEYNRSQEETRKKRVAATAPKVLIEGLKVESQIIDDKPQLVFTGKITNNSDKELEAIRLEFRFLGPEREKLMKLHVFPVYPTPEGNKGPVKIGGKMDFVETIASEIPNNWTGDFEWEVFDLGSIADIKSYDQRE